MLFTRSDKYNVDKVLVILHRNLWLLLSKTLESVAPNITFRAGLHYGGEVHRSWKKGVSQVWLVENATLDRWVFTLSEENNGGELFSWRIIWHGRLRGGTFWSWASPEKEFLVRPQEPDKPHSIRNILLPWILLWHIHHLPHITMSWPSILDRPEAFSTVV